VAVELIDDHMKPLATPNSSTGGMTAHSEVSLSRIDPNQNRANEKDPSPIPARIRGSPGATRRPTNGASTTESIAIGASDSAAWVGEQPSTVWTPSMIGT